MLHVDIKRKLPGFTLEASFNTQGGVTGLLGASGSGKSMTLCCIAGIVRPDEGMISLNGKVLFDSKAGVNLPPQKRNVGYLFQNYALFPHMTVGQNIALGLRKKNKRSGQTAGMIRDKVKMFHLEGLEGRYPSELSGGQKQRVALARVLAYEPEALLLDEPFSALDSYLKWQIEPRFLEMLSGYTGSTVLVTHNRDEAYRICSEIAVINRGSIECMDDKEAVFQRPQTASAAQLTGCKNIGRAEKKGDYLLWAVDWGVELKTREEVPDGVKFVGIRAHYFKPAAGGDTENSMRMRVIGVSEAPFSVSVTFENAGMEVCGENARLRWETGREEWRLISREGVPDYIVFPPENLLLLR
jgi:molybdate transport system ATP-binding protein